MLNSMIRDLFLGRAPCRRRAAAFISDCPINAAAELLEVRVLPSCVPPGTYKDPLEDPPNSADTLEVFPTDKKKGFGTYDYHPDAGGDGVKFGIKAICKKDSTTIVSRSKGITFSAKIEESVSGIRVIGSIRIGKGPLIAINETMSPI